MAKKMNSCECCSSVDKPIKGGPSMGDKARVGMPHVEASEPMHKNMQKKMPTKGRK